MKKIIILFTTLLIFSACATTNQAKLSRIEAKKDKKLAEQAMVKAAVESKRYLIKFDKIYYSHGGWADLIPRANYMIIEGDQAFINTAYLGRQVDIRPIVAINLKGKATNYIMSDEPAKGMYKIKMDVAADGSNSFDVYLTIGKDGFCSASFSSLRIDHVNYSGHLVPMEIKKSAIETRGLPI
jgi:hypothetical protein